MTTGILEVPVDRLVGAPKAHPHLRGRNAQHGRARRDPRRGRRPASVLHRHIAGRVVYLASRVALYTTPFYRRAEQVLATAGAARVISARDRFPDHDTWLRDFPRVIRQLDVIVVALGPDRAIGTGVAREIIEAVVHQVPVYFLTPAWRFHPLVGAKLVVPHRPTRRRFARVELSWRGGP
jgi:hypothetical protein